MFDYTERVRRLRGALEQHRLDAFVTTFSPHLRYVSGYSGSNGLCIVTSSAVFFFTDFRYKEQIESEVECSRSYITTGNLIEKASEEKLLRRCKRVGVEKDHLPLSQYLELRKNFSAARFLPTSDIIESFASVKTEPEIALIRKAVEITEAAFRDVLKLLGPGVSELDISAEISYRHKKYGAENDSFEPIVVSGRRGSLPHGTPSSKKISHGDMVTLDLGCFYRGYCSDLTRTVSVGKPSQEAKKIYRVVHEAQQRAIHAAAAGMSAKKLDAVAREYIRSMGYGRYFGHGLGHGIGLRIHEYPRISSTSTHALVKGNVVTVEPGIYLPGRCGVRIEDDIVIRNGECEVLTTLPTTMVVL